MQCHNCPVTKSSLTFTTQLVTRNSQFLTPTSQLPTLRTQGVHGIERSSRYLKPSSYSPFGPQNRLRAVRPAERDYASSLAPERLRVSTGSRSRSSVTTRDGRTGPTFWLHPSWTLFELGMSGIVCSMSARRMTNFWSSLLVAWGFFCGEES